MSIAVDTPSFAPSSLRSIRPGLIWTLVRTDFKARYHGTIGGFVWALLKPLSMFVVLMLVFSLVFASSQTYRLDLIIGLFLWDFFAEGTKAGLVSLHTRAFLMTKGRCPAWILVVTSISNALVTLVIFAGIIAMFLSLSGRPPSLAALIAFAFYCLALALIVIGFSLASSVLFLRYRDLNQVWEVIVQAGFFVAPVIYPLDVIPTRFQGVLFVWPPTAAIELARSALVAGQLPSAAAHLFLLADAAVCLAIGVTVFRRLQPRAAEYL
jgi:lipopolysaccharide transport system permease protein